MAITRLSSLMIKKEATKNTAVKPTNAVRYKEGGIMAKQEIIANNPVQNNRALALNAVKGKLEVDGTLKTDLDLNDGVHFLYSALGTMVSTDISSLTDGSVYLHEITPANRLHTFTMEQPKGDTDLTTQNRQRYVVDRGYGLMVGNLKMAGSDGIIEMDATIWGAGVFQKADVTANVTAGAGVVVPLSSVDGLIVGDIVNFYDNTPINETTTITAVDPVLKTITVTLVNNYAVANKAKVELTPQVPTYLDPEILSYRDLTVQFGDDLTSAGTATPVNIKSWELEYDNGLTREFGNKSAFIEAKGYSAKMKYEVFFETSEERDRYLNLTKQACIFTLTNNKVISNTDTNLHKYELVIKMPYIVYNSYEMPSGTDEIYMVSCEVDLYYDYTENYELKMEVKNGLAPATYS
jgi:hypothetical protein